MSESNNLPQAISHKKLNYLMLKAQKDSHFSDELAEIESPEKRESFCALSIKQLNFL